MTVMAGAVALATIVIRTVVRTDPTQLAARRIHFRKGNVMAHRPSPVRFVRVILSCGHDNQYREPAPHDGDLLWCYRCQDHKIVEVVGRKFRVKCVRAGCSYVKRTGMGQRQAEQFALKHHQDRKHPVNVYDGYKLVSKYRGEPNPDQLTLQFDNEAPPF